jgi:phage protein D
MTLGKQSRPWANVTDSEAIQKLAKEYSLAADIDTTDEKHPQIEQNQESDFELMKKLAARNHFEFYVSPAKTLRFGKPNDEGDGVTTLRWGQSLLSFKPEANLAAQVSQVEVYGWNSDQKKPIVGKAVAGEESGHDPRRRSGGERLSAALGKRPVLQVRQPVFTEAEAKRRAQAILNDHAKKFLTGDAESIGLPALLPDRNITLGNLGEPFSKTYYISQTVHKIDSNGYRTRVKVKETSL